MRAGNFVPLVEHPGGVGGDADDLCLVLLLLDVAVDQLPLLALEERDLFSDVGDLRRHHLGGRLEL